MMFFSCNITKSLKDNEKLLVKNKIIIVDNTIDTKDPGFEEYDIKQTIKPKPNTKFLKLPMKLWVYNLSKPEKVKEKVKRKNERCQKNKNKQISRVSKKIRPLEKEMKNSKINSSKYNRYNKRLLNLQNRKAKKEERKCNKLTFSQKVGEPPVLYTFNDEHINKRKIRVLLKNKGYYKPIIKVNSTSRKKNPKKITVNYKIIPGEAYLINKIEYSIEDPLIEKDVLADTAGAKIKKGSRLDTKLIESERKRISDQLRNKGYYKFSKDFIFFSVDTIGKNRLSDLVINIKNPLPENKDSSFHKKYKIRNVYIYPRFKPKEALVNKDNYYLKNDTIIFYSKKGLKYNIIYNDIPRINPKSLIRGLYIAPGKYYHTKDMIASYKYLASLQIIQIAKIDFIDVQVQSEENDSIGYIDCEIRLTQDMLQSNTVAAEMTNTSGNLGIAVNNNYKHLNIFRNTEVLNLKLNFALKRITKNSEDSSYTETQGFFNSREYGGDLNIRFPRLVAPLPLKKFIKRSNPYTIVQVNYNFLERPDYTRSIAGISFGYNWNSTKTISHSFIPINGDLVKLHNSTEEFLEYIEKWKLEEVYNDRLVFGSSYRFTFNNQFVSQKRNFIFFSIYAKPAGNSLSLIMKMSDKEKEDGSYKFADNVFAQFIKTDFDLRYFRKLSREKDILVFRIFAGIAYPYGNLEVIPINERYSSGGANGIRAWPIRTLGPGSYKSEDIYPNQTSDIKLEANFEYRMKLFSILEGALFIDGGNIWAINDQDTREGAIFEFNDFYKEIAVGTGFGLRFDFDFLVIRFDFGRKILDPTRDINQRFILIRPDDMNITDVWSLNFGIGYPF